MPWRHIGEWRYSSTILDLCTRWRWVISFTPLPLYREGKSPRYPLDRRLGGPQSQYGCWKSNPGHPACSQSLYWLSCPDSLCSGYPENVPKHWCVSTKLYGITSQKTVILKISVSAHRPCICFAACNKHQCLALSYWMLYHCCHNICSFLKVLQAVL
jgi:hypothetical protein